LFDREKKELNDSIIALKTEIAELRGERKARQKELGLTDDVIRLKTDIEDLRISKSRLTEEHEREKRELTHMVGLEKKRQEVELTQGKQAATLAVREENLTADRKRFEEQMAFTSKRFESEVGYLKELMVQVLERLPTVTVDKKVSDRPTPVRKVA
jgi:hypothetical protein